MGFIVTLGLAGVGQPASAADQAGPVTIPLWIRNTAQVPDDVLTGAQTEVTKIYRQAGVETMWLAPTSSFANTEANRGPWLTIAILSRDQAQLLNPAITRDGVGVAPATPARRGHVAYVFYHRVEKLTGGNGLNLAQVLGISMAHEIGHLLLPYRAHAPTGLMRANWSKADLQLAQRSQLFFTAKQGELIRSRMAAATKGVL
jgi:hypothetical protein